MISDQALSPSELRAAFDRSDGLTVGVEEELMLVDPATLDLAAMAPRVLEALAGDPRFRPELPAAQIEIVTEPAAAVCDVTAQLAGAHADLLAATTPWALVAGAGAHPFASPVGAMSPGQRYREIVAEYGWAAVRGVVFGLHVHVAVGGADRTLAVYNAARSYLPEIAALAGNTPFHAGDDTGLASVRPKIAEGFPRQGVPPVIPDWEHFAELLAWGRRSGGIPDAKYLWWELRLHPLHGTLELRAPDMPSTLRDTAAITAVFQSLVGWLAARHDAGEKLPAVADVRIDENRWRALRHGLAGELADLETGEPEWTRERIGRLLDELDPVAQRLGAAAELRDARELLACNGAERQRAVAAERGLEGLVEWLVERFRAA